jgi:hypothetical protein
VAGFQGAGALWSGTGVAGSGTTYGVTGFSQSGDGIRGFSQSGDGIRGSTNTGNFGVVGERGDHGLTEAYVGNAGVWGDASSVVGVFGTSGTNVGVAGATNSADSYGGHFRNATSGGGTALFVDGNGGAGGTKPTIAAANGATLTDSGVWTNASDAALKTDFEKLDAEALLEQLDRLTVSSWRYRSDPADGPRHIGPTAQGFEEAFGLGGDGKSISTIDPAGIALAVAQELARRLEDRDCELAELRRRVARLEHRR